MKEVAKKSEVAVIAVGGKQHLVNVGQKISVNRLTAKEGETVIETDLLKKTPVTLKVIAHNLGDKIRGLKFRRKVRYTRHYGHRQHLTELEVIGIGEKKPVVEAKESLLSDKPIKKPTAKKPTNKKTPVKKAKEVKNGQ